MNKNKSDNNVAHRCSMNYLNMPMDYIVIMLKWTGRMVIYGNIIQPPWSFPLYQRPSPLKMHDFFEVMMHVPKKCTSFYSCSSF